MENNIIIDDGSKKFTFSNNLGEVFAEFSFNPSDTGLVTRYEQIVKNISSYHYDNTHGDTVEEINKLEAFIADQFTELLKKDANETLFKVYTPCAIFANGDFYCEILIENIGSIIEKEIGVRLKKKAARIKKATAKYHK